MDVVGQFSDDGEPEVICSGPMPEFLRDKRLLDTNEIDYNLRVLGAEFLLERLSDRTILREIMRRLNLKPAQRRDTYGLGDNEYILMDNGDIVIGQGDGYNGFHVIFDFDGDKLTGHGVWE